MAVDEASVSFGDGGDNDDGTAARPADRSAQGVINAFGRSMKMLRLRSGMERAEFGQQLGYTASTVASFEQGRRIPSPRTIDRADEVLEAGGLLSVWKEQMERAQFPVFFQGMAALEKKCVELLMYDTHVVNGLLQTEEYMRALLAMRRPTLDQETIDQRVTARLARQAIFDRRPAPLLSFVMDEAVLRHRYGGNEVLRGQAGTPSADRAAAQRRDPGHAARLRGQRGRERALHRGHAKGRQEVRVLRGPRHQHTGDRPGTDGPRCRPLWDYPIPGSHSPRVAGTHRRVAGIAMNNAECSATASDLAWFKSSYSGTEGGQCVEVAAGAGVVHVRDSKDVTRPVIRVSREAWAGFVGMASSEPGV